MYSGGQKHSSDLGSTTRFQWKPSCTLVYADSNLSRSLPPQPTQLAASWLSAALYQGQAILNSHTHYLSLNSPHSSAAICGSSFSTVCRLLFITWVERRSTHFNFVHTLDHHVKKDSSVWWWARILWWSPRTGRHQHSQHCCLSLHSDQRSPGTPKQHGNRTGTDPAPKRVEPIISKNKLPFSIKTLFLITVSALTLLVWKKLHQAENTYLRLDHCWTLGA